LLRRYAPRNDRALAGFSSQSENAPGRERRLASRRCATVTANGGAPRYLDEGGDPSCLEPRCRLDDDNRPRSSVHASPRCVSPVGLSAAAVVPPGWLALVPDRTGTSAPLRRVEGRSSARSGSSQALARRRTRSVRCTSAVRRAPSAGTPGLARRLPRPSTGLPPVERACECASLSPSPTDAHNMDRVARVATAPATTA
jgi:hypothetical protein